MNRTAAAQKSLQGPGPLTFSFDLSTDKLNLSYMIHRQ